VFDDITYWGNAVREPLMLGEELGTGVIPSCSDTSPPDPTPEQNVTVRALAGISADVAVALERDPTTSPGEHTVYLAPGFLVQNPAHPLHDTLYGGPEEPNEERGFECEPPVRFQARAATTPGSVVFRVESEDAAVAPLLERHEGDVFVDANTRVSGLEREGVPYVAEGDEFELVVRACSRGDDEQLLVAKSLTRG
jgi:hypothetical protein